MVPTRPPPAPKPWMNFWLQGSAKQQATLPHSKRSSPGNAMLPATVAVPPLSTPSPSAEPATTDASANTPVGEPAGTPEAKRGDALDRWLDHFFEEEAIHTLGPVSPREARVTNGSARVYRRKYANEHAEDGSGSDSTSAEEAEELRAHMELIRNDEDFDSTTTTEGEEDEDEKRD